MSKLSNILVGAIAISSLGGTFFMASVVEDNVKQQTQEVKVINEHINKLDKEIDDIKKVNTDNQKQLKALKAEQEKQAKELSKN